MNQMREKILAALCAAAEERDLEWVEVETSSCEGTVRIQQPGQFRTLLRLEYEFHPRSCRLMAYLAGQRAAGRCGIDYDDGTQLEQFLTQFGQLLPEAGPSEVVAKFVAGQGGGDGSRFRGRFALVQ